MVELQRIFYVCLRVCTYDKIERERERDPENRVMYIINFLLL